MICINPIKLYNRNTGYVNRFNCGKCINCRYQRANEWTNRLVDEATGHEAMSLIVLTYRENNIKKGAKIRGKRKNTLWYPDVQMYLKRLRRDLDRNHKHKNGNDIRYYCACEYGEKEARPHYHLVLFGLGRKDRNIIDRNWHDGNVMWDKHNRPLDRKGFAYAAGYIDKKIYAGTSDWYYTKKGIMAPKNYQSKGIGYKHANKFREWYMGNNLNYKSELDTHYGLTVPRSYIKLWKKQDDKMLAEVNKQYHEGTLTEVEHWTYSQQIKKYGIKELVIKIGQENLRKKYEELNKQGIITDYYDRKNWTAKDRLITSFQCDVKNYDKITGEAMPSKKRIEKLRFQDKYQITQELMDYELKIAKEIAEVRERKQKEYRKTF